MKLTGKPVVIQNTDDRHWLVTIEDFPAGIEHVSFTVAVPRSQKSLGEIQKEAVRRAIELLQQGLEVSPAPSADPARPEG